MPPVPQGGKCGSAEACGESRHRNSISHATPRFRSAALGVTTIWRECADLQICETTKTQSITRPFNKPNTTASRRAGSNSNQQQNTHLSIAPTYSASQLKSSYNPHRGPRLSNIIRSEIKNVKYYSLFAKPINATATQRLMLSVIITITRNTAFYTFIVQL